MAEYYDVDRITNDQTGDVFHLKKYIDDTAGDGDTEKTWSADKLTSEFDNKESALNRIGLCTYNGQFYINPDGNNVRTA